MTSTEEVYKGFAVTCNKVIPSFLEILIANEVEEEQGIAIAQLFLTEVLRASFERRGVTDNQDLVLGYLMNETQNVQIIDLSDRLRELNKKAKALSQSESVTS